VKRLVMTGTLILVSSLNAVAMAADPTTDAVAAPAGAGSTLVGHASSSHAGIATGGSLKAKAMAAAAGGSTAGSGMAGASSTGNDQIPAAVLAKGAAAANGNAAALSLPTDPYHPLGYSRYGRYYGRHYSYGYTSGYRY
jgi:hypothetical protein